MAVGSSEEDNFILDHGFKALLRMWTGLVSLLWGDWQNATVYVSERLDMLRQVDRYVEGV